MKRLLAVLLIIVSVCSCANAGFSIPKDENIVLKFNAWAEIFGAPKLDFDEVAKGDGFIAFAMDGYDVIFLLDEDDSLSSAGVRFSEERVAGDALLSGMAVISAFGDMDYTAFGNLLFQYSEVRANKSNTLPYYIKGDYFNFDPNQDKFKYVFVYMNMNKDESF